MMVSVEALRQIDWTFRETKAKEGIHGLHNYPAMMAPPVACTLIRMLSREGDVVLDPFCGSGTVTTVAAFLGRHSIGFDINPLALLIAEVKITPLSPSVLRQTFEQVQNNLQQLGHVELQRFANIDYWFKPEVQHQLARLKAAIDMLEHDAARKFCLVIFSRVVREVSNTRSNEFKLFRLPPEKLERHRPDVLAVFRERFWKCAALMDEWWRQTKGKLVVPHLQLHDARQSLPIAPESVDLVLTSPPYGDARTTVAYGQFSRLSLQWLGLWQQDLDRLSLGGMPRAFYAPPPLLREVLSAISKQSPKRAQEVEAFYADLCDCLHNIAVVVKQGGYAVFVIANRKVKGIKLPTDRLILEMLPDFRHITTMPRQIPNKQMPLRNSPSNIPGETDITMLEEYIVVLQKVSVTANRPINYGQLRLLEKRRRYKR